MLKSGGPAAGQVRFTPGAQVLSGRVPEIGRRLGKNLVVQVTALLFFALLGVGLYHQALRPDFPPHHLVHLPLQEEVVLSGRVYRPSRVGPEWVRLYVAAAAWKSPEGWRPATGRLLVTAPRLTPPTQGTHVVVRGKLREPQALKNPGAWNRPRQLAAEGIFRQMHLSEAASLVSLASEGSSPVERLRGGIRRLLQDRAPAVRAMYLAMLLGDQGEVTQEMRRQFSRTGTSHLLAISGLHLGSLAGLTYLAGFWLLRRFPWLLLRVNVMKVATVAAAVPVVAYAHLAGGSPATHRAEVMILAYLLLVLLGRPREVWSALALAALVLLTLNPLLLLSVSFQLSFAAVAGLLWFLPRWFDSEARDPDPANPRRGWLPRWARRLLEALAVSAVASLVTAPLVAHYFQVVSLFGFLVNLAAIPLVLMLALPLGGLAVLAEALALTPLARVLLDIGQIPLNWGYTIIAGVAAWPGSGATVPTPSWLQVALWYAMIFLVLTLISQLLTLRWLSKNRPDKDREPRVAWTKFCWTGVGAGLVGVALVASVALTGFRTPDVGEITILDSYAGLDGILVAPEGQRVVVAAAWDVWPGQEGGGGLGALPSYLHWRQWRRLDAVLALKLNARNAQEMLTLAQEFEIGGFWWEGRRPAGKMIDLMNWLGDAGRPGLSLTRIRPPLNPPGSLGGLSLTYPTWEKGQGVALKITCQGQQTLILPPLKRSVLEMLPGLKESPLAVLVAPGDVSPAVVARLQPETLVLYGHREPGAKNPDPAGPSPYLTRQGAVTLTFTGKGATCTQWRP
jgi:ComEC/Rec2-related protein